MPLRIQILTANLLSAELIKKTLHNQEEFNKLSDTQISELEQIHKKRFPNNSELEEIHKKHFPDNCKKFQILQVNKLAQELLEDLNLAPNYKYNHIHEALKLIPKKPDEDLKKFSNLSNKQKTTLKTICKILMDLNNMEPFKDLLNAFEMEKTRLSSILSMLDKQYNVESCVNALLKNT